MGLHEALGFEPVGVYRRVAWKFGEWWDVGWWQLQLLPAGTERPPEPMCPNPMNAQPFVAVVTGASSGIGEATARRLAREPGAQLVLVARREERLRALAESLGVPAGFVAVDLTSDGAPAEVLRHVRDTHGRLDLLVNNAGCGVARHLRRRRPREREPDHGAQLPRPGAPDRGAPPAAAGVGAQRDRERVERVRPRGPRRVGRLQRQQVRAGRLVGLALPGGARNRRARGAGAAGLRGHRGLPGGGAQGAHDHPLDGLQAGARGRRDRATPARAASPSATSRARTCSPPCPACWPRPCTGA